MKKILPIAFVILLLAGIVVLAVFAVKNGELDNTVDAGSISAEGVEKEEAGDINDAHLRDIDSLYEDDDPYDVVTMYLTVRQGNASDGTNHTWKEVNEHSAYYYDDLGIPRYKVAALLQVGDENGPVKGELGYDETLPNATVQIRGQTSSMSAQKNYKIKLVKGSEGWRGQTTIALNKHRSEGLRFRNKMAYDLMSGIPQIMSLRTQFVHLYVRDMTGDNPDKFVDYGLYTQVEQLNKTALKAHGLDKNGYLYKINFFEFFEYDELKLVTDPDYDAQKFNDYLEPKGREDHEKLLEMIHAVNDYSVTTEELFEKYFDKENIAYWMAYMLLTGNCDTQSRNSYIYSPLNGDKWYLYPWDNDASFIEEEEIVKKFSDFNDWQRGISNYWGNMLFRRCLMSADFRKALDDAINDLRENYLTPEHIKDIAQKYRDVVYKYNYSMPDIEYEPLTKAEYDRVFNAITDELERNYERYVTSTKAPMPFHVSVPENDGKNVMFAWDSSYDMSNTEVTYNFKLARDYEFKDVIFEANDLKITTVSKELQLEPGQYFIHVDATNELGIKMNCFDYYPSTEGSVYGTFCFFVDENGEFEAYENVEGDE